MSLRNTLRAMPVLLRVGFAEAVAYRTELLIWILATTMPLVMLALFSTVAQEAPLGRFGQTQFTAYFLATFIVRQLVGSWVAWQMNFEVRQGTLATRLLRPVHPLWSYAVEMLAALPLRLVVALPVAIVILLSVGASQLPRDPMLWLAWCVALIGGWLITFLVGVCIGCLSFYFESSLKIMDIWNALFFILSGYIIPIELFPTTIRHVADWLPFRYQIGLPVEIMTSAHHRAATFELLAQQWGFVALFFVLTTLLWRKGLTRFAAYGG